MTSKALVVLSGGQDSTTCLGVALANYDEVHCLTFNYGQRHAREIQAAKDVVAHFERHYERTIPHEVVAIPDMLKGTSPLVAGGEQLETYEDHDSMAAIIGNRVEKTFVPMRNTLFLTIAANRAVVAGMDTLVTGVCQGDNANYPDCTQVFIAYVEEAINESLGYDGANYSNPKRLRINTPLMHLSKADTVRLALDTAYTYSALAWSHTAYDGQYPPVGKDHASLLRAHGFLMATMPDPLVLRAHYEGLMELPDTGNYSETLVASFTNAMCDQWTKGA
jgi:7-cyano-7-deazaguanine synthase